MAMTVIEVDPTEKTEDPDRRLLRLARAALEDIQAGNSLDAAARLHCMIAQLSPECPAEAGPAVVGVGTGRG